MLTQQGIVDDAQDRLAENPWREAPQALLKALVNAEDAPEDLREQAQAVLTQATIARAELEAAGTPGAPDDLWPGYSDDAPPPEGWVPPEPAPDADGIVTFSHV